MRKHKSNLQLKLLGMAMAIMGVVMIVHTIPLMGWYILLSGLAFVLFILLYWRM